MVNVASVCVCVRGRWWVIVTSVHVNVYVLGGNVASVHVHVLGVNVASVQVHVLGGVNATSVLVHVLEWLMLPLYV